MTRVDGASVAVAPRRWLGAEACTVRRAVGGVKVMGHVRVGRLEVKNGEFGSYPMHDEPGRRRVIGP
jgi:hypothetical protein